MYVPSAEWYVGPWIVIRNSHCHGTVLCQRIEKSVCKVIVRWIYVFAGTGVWLEWCLVEKSPISSFWFLTHKCFKHRGFRGCLDLGLRAVTQHLDFNLCLSGVAQSYWHFNFQINEFGIRVGNHIKRSHYNWRSRLIIDLHTGGVVGNI